MLPCSAADYATGVQSQYARRTVHPSDGDERVAAQILDVRLRDASGLTNTLDLISKFYDDNVCLEAYQGKGLQIRAVDQAKCSFVDAFFPATSPHGIQVPFSRFDCAQPYLPMWVAPALLGRAIRTATDGRKRTASSRPFMLHLSVAASDADHLVLEAQTAPTSGQRAIGIIKTTRQDLALLAPISDASSCFVDGNDFRFTGEALFEAPDLLAEILSDVKSSGCEEVTLTLGASSLQLSGKAGDNCSRLQVSLRGSAGCATGPMSIHAPEVPVRSTLKARHLQRLSHLCSDSAQVLLQMGDEAPLSVTFELRGGGTCQIFIAPCLEDDQDDELLHSGCERGAKRKAAGGAGEVAAATKAKGGVSRPGKCGKAGLAGCDGVDGDDGDSWQRGGGASSYGGATTVPYGGVSGDAAWDNGGVRNADDEDEDA